MQTTARENMNLCNWVWLIKTLQLQLYIRSASVCTNFYKFKTVWLSVYLSLHGYFCHIQMIFQRPLFISRLWRDYENELLFSGAPAVGGLNSHSAVWFVSQRSNQTASHLTRRFHGIFKYLWWEDNYAFFFV